MSNTPIGHRKHCLILRICCVLLAGWPLLLAAQLGRTFHNVSVGYKFPGSYRDIRKIDFANLPVHDFERSSNPSQAVPLKNGKYAASSQSSGEERVSLDSVHLLEVSGTNQYALAIYEWDSAGGSSSQEGIAQLFEVSGGNLQIV